MTDRIVRDDSNLVLDPPTCRDPNCEFSRGTLMQQRFNLMCRLYQLNTQLGGDPPRPDDENEEDDEDDQDG